MPGEIPHSPGTPRQLPSLATLFRLRQYNQAAVDLIFGTKEKLKPLLRLRDGGNLKRIQAARTPEELLDLSPHATGLAQDAWHARMRSFGPQTVPSIRETLLQVQALEDAETRYRLNALLIAELRWRGEAGARVLLDSLEALEPGAASLACVALGLINLAGSVEQVWQCYLRLRPLTMEGHFIGGLWGLIDLGDRRAAGELYDFLRRENYFYELYGFLALAGDERALGLLITQAMEQGQKRGADPLMAATAIAHRVGQTALVLELLRTAQQDPGEPESEAHLQAEEISVMVLSRPMDEVREYFALFYRGFQSQDVKGAEALIRQNRG